MDTATKVVSWFGSDDTGLSSEAIAIAGCGGKTPPRGWNYPHDPADFGRCARLLKRIPELRDPAFKRLAEEGGGKWRALIERWDELTAFMDSEVGIDWAKGKSAPATYDLMKEILGEAS